MLGAKHHRNSRKVASFWALDSFDKPTQCYTRSVSPNMRRIEALVLLSTLSTSVLTAESSRPRGVGPECSLPKPPPGTHHELY
jgi:hypothetical protein